jgi:hypothetical protein
MAPPDFGRSVNPISTRGDRLGPPNYYGHPQIFIPSDGPDTIGTSSSTNRYIKMTSSGNFFVKFAVSKLQRNYSLIHRYILSHSSVMWLRFQTE